MPFDRRHFLGSAAGLALVPSLPASVLAKAPLAAAQATGLARIGIGSIEVTAISDGYLDLALAMFSGADETTLKKLMAASFRGEGAHRSSVNAFVVNNGEKLALVDAGTVKGFSPHLGRFLPALALAGFDPAAVDVILATHLHPDHVGGIADELGATFPNAELVVHEKEHAFWTDEGIASRAPQEVQPFFRMANAAIKPYAGRTRKVKGSQEVIPGVTTVELFGHTPGHVGYRIASGGKQLLLWGDVVHAPALQFANPAISIAFDADVGTARENRLKILEQVAAERIMVSGAHLDFPGFGFVAKSGAGYAFTPAPFGFGL